MAAHDDLLENWEDLRTEQWPTLLLGNGFSINLWDRFQYSTLLAEARLNRRAKRLFKALNTNNFETALQSLYHAHVALEAMRKSPRQVDGLYDHVRDRLFEAIARVHVPWSEFPQTGHVAIADELESHRNLFTTNYDLCPYWSYLQAKRNFKDFFWNDGYTFDPANTSVSGSAMYYLHGAIHLWQDDRTGLNGKWTSSAGNLLDTGANYTTGSSRQPLFVSEGTSAAKLRSIGQSHYLSFCLKRLTEDANPTVVFGHSLSGPDSHVVNALAAGGPRPIAVSMRATGTANNRIKAKADIAGRLAPNTVRFFDAATHPLGLPALHIGP